MATSALPLRQPSRHASTYVVKLADELRMIVERHGASETRSVVNEFVTRHRLTHPDIDALLTLLALGDLAEDATNRDPFRTAPVPVDAAGTECAEAYDDLVWMFGDGSDSPTSQGADDVMGQALEDLLGDWSRTGGQLARADVALLATRRKFSPTQHAELLDLLEEAGVDLPDPTGPLPRISTTKGYGARGDSVSYYLRAIARYPLIDGTREVELWSLISQGLAAQDQLEAAGEGELTPAVQRRLLAQAEVGRHAHAELVCANLRLVVSIAKARHYDSSGIEFADRVQDGNLGLMRAADKFDGSKGFKFSTYATWWIRQAIERGIGDRGRTIRLPIHLHEKVQSVRKALSGLTARLDREPTLAELSDATGMEPGAVQFALDLMRPCRSLDERLGEDGDLRLSDVLGADEDRDGRTDPVEIVLQTMFRRDVARALKTLLPERNAKIIERRFGLGTGEKATLDDIGADLGLTRERIRQLEGKALATLRESDEAAALRAYLIDDSKASTERENEQQRQPVPGTGVRGVRHVARSPRGGGRAR